MVPSAVSPPKHGPGAGAGRFRCLNRKHCPGLDDFKAIHKLAFNIPTKYGLWNDDLVVAFGHLFEERLSVCLKHISGNFERIENRGSEMVNETTRGIVSFDL